jgi:amino acid transporter
MSDATTIASVDPDATNADPAIKRRIWKACIWSWVVCIVAFGFFFVVVAGFIPPPRENWSAQRIAEFYADNRDAKRIGLLGALFASVLLLPFFTVISAEMRKIEGRYPLLAIMQWGGALVLVTFFQIICLGWLTASLRPDAAPDIARVLNDYGWMVWSTLIPTYVLQFVCIACVGFMDRRPHPTWPRWAAYTNLWVAVTGCGGVLAVFFRTGPFTWHGAIGFWIPVIIFVLGMTMNMVLLLRRLQYEERLASDSQVAPVAQTSLTGVVAGAS